MFKLETSNWCKFWCKVILAVSLQLKPWNVFLYRNHSLKLLYSRAFKCKLSGGRGRNKNQALPFHEKLRFAIITLSQARQKNFVILYLFQNTFFLKKVSLRPELPLQFTREHRQAKSFALQQSTWDNVSQRLWWNWCAFHLIGSKYFHLKKTLLEIFDQLWPWVDAILRTILNKHRNQDACIYSSNSNTQGINLWVLLNWNH